MTRSFEAFTRASPDRPVRTFSHRDLAEAFKQDMEALGTKVIIKTVRLQRRAA